MIGFLIENGNDEQLLQNINQMNKDNRVMVFSESLVPSIQANVVQTLEAFHFNGNMITSSPRLCQQMNHLGYARNRYLYIQDLFWATLETLHLSQLEQTVFNKNVSIIANSATVKTIQSVLNITPKYVMNNHWDINILRQIANE